MIQNCNEQLLDDVVRVDLVLASECKIDIPFQIAKTDMPGTRVVNGSPVDIIGAPGLSLAYNVQDGDDGEIDSAPVLKQTDKTELALLLHYDYGASKKQLCRILKMPIATLDTLFASPEKKSGTPGVY